MPDISIQQAYALAFGAYASPTVPNSSFTIQGSNGLPTNKDLLTGLLTTPNIDLKLIPAEQADTPFNPPNSTYTLATTQSLVNETTSGGSGSVLRAQTGAFDQLSAQLTKFLLVKVSESVSGNLPLDTETVYVSSISPPTFSGEVLPASANITVSSAEGPYNIARLGKTTGGTIQIDILRAKGSDQNFWSVFNMGTVLSTDGLKISITGNVGSFNTIPPNKAEFELTTPEQYPIFDVDSWDSQVSYEVGEFVEYSGQYYECIEETSPGTGSPPDDISSWAEVDTTEAPTFANIVSTSISFNNVTLNGIPVFRIGIPSAFYAATILNRGGRYETNPNWMPVWISISGNTIIVDADTGGGTAGNQCGTLLIKPRNDAYAKNSAWILELSQATPADNTISIGASAQLTSTIFNNTNLVFSTTSTGGVLIPRIVYLIGGDINNSSVITQTEKNYHRTGVGIVNKLKK